MMGFNAKTDTPCDPADVAAGDKFPFGRLAIDGWDTIRADQLLAALIRLDPDAVEGLAFAAPKDISISFTGDGPAYFVAPEELTLAASPVTAGTGTLAYAKALAATPTVFEAANLPVTLEAEDVLRVTVSGLSGYKAVTLRRSA